MNVQVGDKFIATIDSKKKVEGVIQIQNGDVYLCQNKCDGTDCKNKLGYKYSWIIGNLDKIDSKAVLRAYNVYDFQLRNRKSRIEKLEL